MTKKRDKNESNPFEKQFIKYFERFRENTKEGKGKLGKKRHHYLPLFYLQKFTNKTTRKIYQYEKGKDQIITTTPKNIATETNYFAFDTAKGLRDSVSLEDFFSDIESDSKVAFDKLNNEVKLSLREKAIFALLIAYSFTRVPNFRRNINESLSKFVKGSSEFLATDPHRFRRVMDDFLKERPEYKKSNYDLESLREFCLSDRYDVEVNPQANLVFLMTLALEIGNIIFHMKWILIKNDFDFKFLTSDNPVYYTCPGIPVNSLNSGGLADRNVEVTFPISQDIALVASWKNDTDFLCLNGTSKLIKEINKRTVHSAERFVYASQKNSSILNLVNKHKGSAPYFDVVKIPAETESQYFILIRKD